MKYLLGPDYRLLGWKGEPFCLARRSTGTTRRLSPAEFAFLLRCDGETEMAPDEWPPVPEWAVREKIVAECGLGEHLLPEQAYRLYPNRKTEYMELSLTGRCNLNCKHCFNASDCKPRTVEPSLRWRETAPEQTVSTEEWLDFIPDFLDWWYENHIDLDLDVWSYWVGSKGSRRVTIVPDLFSRGEDNRAPSCPASANRFFLDADGRMVRCIALSGITAGLGIPCPNVYAGDDVQQVMTKSDFLTDMTCTCSELKKQNPECLACRWYDRCGTGCRAEALTQGLPDRISLTGIDRRMCLFFNGGCYDRLKAVAEKHGLRY